MSEAGSEQHDAGATDLKTRLAALEAQLAQTQERAEVAERALVARGHQVPPRDGAAASDARNTPDKHLAAILSDIRAIERHPLFDAAWYLARHPDAGSTSYDAAAHYYTVGGWDSGNDPGPRFSVRWYLRANPDVGATHKHGFLHFVTRGETEGRASRPVPPELGRLVAEPGKAIASSLPRYALSGETRLAPRGPACARAGDALTWRGAVLGDHGADVSGALALFSRLQHWDDPSAAGAVASSARMSGSAVAMTDAWFVNESDLRIRLASRDGHAFSEPARLRFHQADGDRLVACGEAAVSGDGPIFATLPLLNPFLPILVTLTAGDGRLSGAGLLPFPTLFRHGPHHGEVAAVAGSEPRFEAVGTYADELLRSHLAASPFLSGLSLDATGATGLERIFSRRVGEWLAQVAAIRIQSANEASPLPKFLADLLAGNRLSPSAAKLSAEGRARHGRARLSIDADSLPSVAALFSSRAPPLAVHGSIARFVSAEKIDGRARFCVGVPAADAEGLDALQPTGCAIPFPWIVPEGSDTSGSDGPATIDWPLAIRFHREPSNEADLFYRRPIDFKHPLLRTAPKGTGRINAVVTVETGFDTLALLLRSLARQTVADRIDVSLIPGSDGAVSADAIRALAGLPFPGRVRVFERADEAADPLREAIHAAAADHLLILDDGVTLHDPRTVEILSVLVEARNVASAGCLHISETIGKTVQITAGAGGLFPRSEPGDAAGTLVETATFASFPHATYPTAGNSFRLALVPAGLLRQFGSLDTQCTMIARARSFAQSATAAGLRHLATSAVSAVVSVREIPKSPAGEVEALSDASAMAAVPRISVVHS